MGILLVPPLSTVMAVNRRDVQENIFSQNETMFEGALGQSVMFGISIPLFIGCLLTRHRRSTPFNTKQQRLIHIYCWIMAVLATAFYIIHMWFFRLSIIDYAQDDWAAKQSWWHVADNVLIGLIAIWADCLMVWRCFIVWGRNYRVVLLPALLVLGTTASLIIWMTQWEGSGWYIFALITTSLSVAVNVLVTTLITFKILYSYHQFKDVLSRAHRRPYISAIGIIVESAALYTVIAVIYIVTFATENPTEQVLISVLGQTPPVATYLIILRVNLGSGITSQTFTLGFSSFDHQNFSNNTNTSPIQTPVDPPTASLPPHYHLRRDLQYIQTQTVRLPFGGGGGGLERINEVTESKLEEA